MHYLGDSRLDSPEALIFGGIGGGTLAGLAAAALRRHEMGKIVDQVETDPEQLKDLDAPEIGTMEKLLLPLSGNYNRGYESARQSINKRDFGVAGRGSDSGGSSNLPYLLEAATRVPVPVVSTVATLYNGYRDNALASKRKF